MAKWGDVCKKAASNIAQKDLECHSGVYPVYGASGFISNVDFYQQEKPYIFNQAGRHEGKKKRTRGALRHFQRSATGKAEKRGGALLHGRRRFAVFSLSIRYPPEAACGLPPPALARRLKRPSAYPAACFIRCIQRRSGENSTSATAKLPAPCIRSNGMPATQYATPPAGPATKACATAYSAP